MATVVGVLGSVGLGAAPAVADATRAASWQLAFLSVARAHQVTQGQGVTVAVVDTGVDATHPDLRGNVVPGFNAWDGTRSTRGLQPTDPHGTAVASLIAGHGHGPGNRNGVLGIAPRAKILPINVRHPRTPLIDPAAIATAIRTAVDARANLVVVALAGSFSREQEAAVAYAEQRGVQVIAGSGNLPDNVVVGYPAAISHVIAVTSVDRTGTLAPYSTTGRRVDISAPGDRIPAARPGGGYQAISGTSVAAAVVGGAAALILAKYPREHINRFTQRLLWTTREAGVKGYDEKLRLGHPGRRRRAHPRAGGARRREAPHRHPQRIRPAPGRRPGRRGRRRVWPAGLRSGCARGRRGRWALPRRLPTQAHQGRRTRRAVRHDELCRSGRWRMTH